MKKGVTRAFWDVMSWAFDKKKNYSFEIRRLSDVHINVRFFAIRGDKAKQKIKMVVSVDQAKELAKKLQKIAV